MFSVFSSISVAYLLNIILAIFIVFLERKDPTATLAWVLVLLVLPGVGFVLYLLLSQNFSRKKLFTMKINARKTFGDFLKKQQDSVNSNKLIFIDKNNEIHKDIIKMNLFRNQSFFTQDNKVQIFTDGREKFEEFFKCIEGAKESIHVMYYIVKNDDLGKKLIALLEKKAQEGVEVRFLYDSIGGRSLNKKSLEGLLNAGGKVGKFFSSLIPLINFKINYRNHRKIVVIDGKIGFVGGFNVGNEYLGLNKRFGYWRDTHVKIIGSAVIDLQRRFFLDWGNATKEDLSYQPKYFPELNVKEEESGAGIQIVSSGPDERDETIKQNYVKLISSARKSVLIQTPYFAPDESVMEALRIAALSGVDVNIMIPNKPDHLFVHWATYYYAGELLKYGVKIYTYENGFLHAKTVVIDGTVASVGTANFDVRSFKLNFEVIAIIYDTETAEKLEKVFYDDVKVSLKLTRELYLQRGIAIKFKESISRLLSPLL
ncbi:cardiolipin synthase [Sedimentibacter sp. zth1]|uniref:cardiolipin synthase n=1 Tax=Sedimentibacter sp. zth1 TaxID=2816908 RepID=UPI001F5EF9C7|nr:cardiolipin synthase [Sedimentibacter sp. zth1]